MGRPALSHSGHLKLLVAAALPMLALELTPGSISAIPRSPESVRGYELLRDNIGPGRHYARVRRGRRRRASGGAEPRIQQATERLVDLAFRDEETKVVASGTDERYVDPTGRYARVIVAGRHEFGEKQMQHFVQRLRGEPRPPRELSRTTQQWSWRSPWRRGSDFLADRAYGAFPWLIGALLALTYLILRAFLLPPLLPLKAVLLNLLSVAAAYGLVGS